MSYPRECVEEFEAKFPPKRGADEIYYDESLGRYTGLVTDFAAIAKQNGRLEVFTHQWERRRRLEEALRAFVGNSSVQTNCPHECEQAEKLLEES